MTFGVVDQSFQQKKTPDFFETKLILVGAVLGLGLGSELVPKVVLWVLFEISVLITLEPHVGHTNFPDFYTLLS